MWKLSFCALLFSEEPIHPQVSSISQSEALRWKTARCLCFFLLLLSLLSHPCAFEKYLKYFKLTFNRLISALIRKFNSHLFRRHFEIFLTYMHLQCTPSTWITALFNKCRRNRLRVHHYYGSHKVTIITSSTLLSVPWCLQKCMNELHFKSYSE